MGIFKMICLICRRAIPPGLSEKHHLTPACKKGKETIIVCCDCANQIHELFSIAELNRFYNTMEALVNEPRMQTWIRWVRKRKEFGICMKSKKRK